jgi:hypothetical protein
LHFLCIFCSTEIFTIFCLIETKEYRDSVVSIRKKCQNVAKNRLVFIDGSGIRAEPRQLKGLAPLGQTAKTTASKPEKYEPRVDIMGAISYTSPLACETKTSKQRKNYLNPRKLSKKNKKGVKGYTKQMVKDFLRLKLAPKIKEMKAKKIIVCMDKGLAFKEEEAKEQFRLGELTKSRIYGFYQPILLNMLVHWTIRYATHLKNECVQGSRSQKITQQK